MNTAQHIADHFATTPDALVFDDTSGEITYICGTRCNAWTVNVPNVSGRVVSAWDVWTDAITGRVVKSLPA